MLYGIDISHHQSDKTPFPLTAAALKAERTSFVVAKATQGYCKPGVWRRDWNFRDSSFEDHVKAARDAGVEVVGAYHYLLAETDLTADGRAQAEFFVRAVEQVAPGGADMLLAVDFEWSDWRTSLDAPADFSPRWPDLRAFTRRFRALLPDHPLLLYTAPGYAGRLGGHDVSELDERTYAWNAAWPDMDPARPDLQTYLGRLGKVDDDWVADLPGWRTGWGGFGRTTLLQFSDRARWGPRRVDANAFDGRIDDLRALATGQAPAPAAAAADPTDRPGYRRGYNDLIDAVVTAAANAPVPVGNAAHERGVAAARADLAERLPGLRLRAPDEV